MVRVDAGQTLEVRTQRVPLTSSQPTSAHEACELYAERVHRFAYLVSRNADDAQDLAQDALERVIRGWATFDARRGDIEGWLWRIVLNSANDAGRGQKRRATLLERARALLLRPSHSAGDLPPGVRDLDLLESIRRLSPRARMLIALRYGSDLEWAEVARAADTTVAAAKMGTRRALDALRSDLVNDKTGGSK